MRREAGALRLLSFGFGLNRPLSHRAPNGITLVGRVGELAGQALLPLQAEKI